MTDQLPPGAFERSGPQRSDQDRSNSGPAPEQVAAADSSQDTLAPELAQALSSELTSELAHDSAPDSFRGSSGQPPREPVPDEDGPSEPGGAAEAERPRRRRRGGRGRRRGVDSAAARTDDETTSPPTAGGASAAGAMTVTGDADFERAPTYVPQAQPLPVDDSVADVAELRAEEADPVADEQNATSDAPGARRSRRRRGGRRRGRRGTPGETESGGLSEQAESDAARDAIAPTFDQVEAESPNLGAEAALVDAPEFDDDFDIPAAAAAGPRNAQDGQPQPVGEESRAGRRRGRRRGRRGGVTGLNDRPEPGQSAPERSTDAAAGRVQAPGDRAEPTGASKRSRRGRRRRGVAEAQGPVGVEWIPGEENELALEPLDTARAPDKGAALREPREEPKADGGRRRGGKRKERAEARENDDVDAGARPKPGRPNIILVNAADREEIRVAVVEGGQIVDFQMHVKRHETLVNDIYRGKVVNLEPAIGAAFIDFGEGRNGFLHTSDVLAVYGDPDWRLDKLLTHKIDPEEWDEKSSQPHVAAELGQLLRDTGPRIGGSGARPPQDLTVDADSDDEAGAGLEPASDVHHDGLDHDDLHERLLAHHDERGDDEHHEHDHLAVFGEHAHASDVLESADGLELLDVIEDSDTAQSDSGPHVAVPESPGDDDVEHLASLRARAPLDRTSSDELGWSSSDADASASIGDASEAAELEAAEPQPLVADRAPATADRTRQGDGGRGTENGRSGRASRAAKGARDADARRHGRPRARPRLPITDLLDKGQSVVVQVTKDAIGDKGPTLTTYISIPGRYLVLMPSMSRTGVSRKIEDEKERRRLKRILESLDVPEGMGVIVRTAGTGCTREDLRRDLDYLMLLWDTFGKRLNLGRGPAPLYEESDVAIRTIRDLFNDHTDAVYVDDEKVYQRVREFMEKLIPEKVDRVQLHTGPKPLFHTHNVEQDFERIFARRIDLASGGSIVLDQTEALVAIDVNSGKTRSEGFDFENIALRTNLDAVKEIARQIRLRDLGGIIVCDFIDMQRSSSRRQVERALRDAMDSDRARSKLGRISQFGLLELTRQRLGPGLSKMLFSNCPRCRGSGRIRTVESRVGAILRRLGAALTLKGFQKVELRAAPEVIEHLRRYCGNELRDLEARHERQIELFAAADQLEDSVLRYLRADGREVRPGGRRKR